MRRMIAPLLIGLIGAALLVALGVWQVQRLAWKQALLDDMALRITAAPVALPATPDPVRDSYLPVMVQGRYDGAQLRVLASRKQVGPGFRLIAPLVLDDGRRVLIDRGFWPETQGIAPPATGPAQITGNLHWPAEVDSFTPPPDVATGLWFARDVPAMAAALNSLPLLIVAREGAGDGVEPLPVDLSGVPNDHLGYAITWFSLAVVWLGMTGLWVSRIRRRSDPPANLGA